MTLTHIFSFLIDDELVANIQEQLKTGNEFSMTIDPDHTSVKCKWHEEKLILSWHLPDMVSTSRERGSELLTIKAKLYHEDHYIDSLKDLGTRLKGKEQDLQFRIDNYTRKALLEFVPEPESGWAKKHHLVLD